MNVLLSFFQSHDILLLAESLIRILLSVFCGAAIGYERKSRGKGAGLRTHIIVSLASCFMMLVSQYGFLDFYARIGGVGHDPARMAAQIVSGIGFLGAGMIFVHKRNITGLTTAAGIWATAGIGMGIGGGMYFLSIVATVIIVLLQMVLHKYRIFQTHYDEEFTFVVKNSKEDISNLMSLLSEFEVEILETDYEKTEDGHVLVSILTHPKKLDRGGLLARVAQEENILSAKF